MLGPPDHLCPGHTDNWSWQPEPRDGRPREGKRLTPDAPHNAGRPAPRMRGLAARPTCGRPMGKKRLTPRWASERPAGPGEQRSAPARGANVQGPPPAPHRAHSMCSKTSRYRHGTATRSLHPIFCCQAQRHNKGGAHGPMQKRAHNLRRWTGWTRSSGHWDSEAATRTPPQGTRMRTLTWR